MNKNLMALKNYVPLCIKHNLYCLKCELKVEDMSLNKKNIS